jgi:hypothetical protein
LPDLAADPAPIADTAPVAACPSCGHQMDAAVLREAQALAGWQFHASQRMQWLSVQLAEPATGHLPPPQPSVPQPAARPGQGGSLLLAAGVVLLVLAGIAFLAFTWHLLGPVGQIAVLLALGALCVWVCLLLLTSLRGTAESVGIVGVLLITIASLGARVVGPDHVGEVASLIVSVVIALALIAAGVQMRPRTAGVGELAAGLGAVLSVALLATAPLDDAIPVSGSWTWWVALVAGAAGAAMLVLSERLGLRVWPVIAFGWLVIASLAFATWTSQLSDELAANIEGLAFAVGLAVAAVAASLTFQRSVGHRVAVTVVVLVDWSLAVLVAWFSGIGSGDTRGWTALVLLVVGALGVAPGVLNIWPVGLRRATTIAGMLVMASAVGMGIPPFVHATLAIDPGSWAEQAWPVWRGCVAGAAFVGVLAITVLVVRRYPQIAGGLPPSLSKALPVASLLPLATTAASLGTWLIAAQADRDTVTTPSYATYGMGALPTPPSLTRQVALALVVVAIGVLIAGLLRVVPTWAVWVLPALAVPAVLMQIATLSWSFSAEPEVIGMVLAVPTVVAAVAWWRLRRPRSTPTWQTVTPAFVIAVLPSTVSLLDDTTDRWWYSEEPTTAYQLRMVGLLAIGVVAAVVGARQRWIGLFIPGLVLALLIGSIELIDLGRFLPQWVSFGLAGALLIAAGARWEWLRNQGRTSAAWMGTLR